jgi:biopolymer transport protein ExbB/TolQ
MIIYLLIFVIFALCAFSVMQLKLAGLNVKDFWSFIEANQMLDKLYNFSKKYEKMSSQEQVIFLMEAEKVFDAFDKVPKIIWEEEYEKYMDVLNTYKDIKVLRWASN